jgi:probable F420-dependent oxidoreductase
MRFGALLMYERLNDPEFLLRAAQMLEEFGFDSLWLGDHIVVPTQYSSVYPYNEEGRVPVERFPEPLISLASLASVTRRIELGTGVLVLPQRNPVLLAKQAATLNALAEGRLRLGVGVGWLREEFEALGSSFDQRGKRTDEYIDAMRALWTDEAPCYDGAYVQLRGTFELAPRPSQQGGVKVVVGGHSPAAARRAARRGDGFFPFTLDSEELFPLYDLVRQEASLVGRSSDQIELHGPTRGLPGWLPRLVDAGVTHAIMPSGHPGSDLETLKGRLGRFSERVIERVGG